MIDQFTIVDCFRLVAELQLLVGSCVGCFWVFLVPRYLFLRVLEQRILGGCFFVRYFQRPVLLYHEVSAVFRLLNSFTQYVKCIIWVPLAGV